MHAGLVGKFASAAAAYSASPDAAPRIEHSGVPGADEGSVKIWLRVPAPSKPMQTALNIFQPARRADPKTKTTQQEKARLTTIGDAPIQETRRGSQGWPLMASSVSSKVKVPPNLRLFFGPIFVRSRGEGTPPCDLV